MRHSHDSGESFSELETPLLSICATSATTRDAAAAVMYGVPGFAEFVHTVETRGRAGGLARPLRDVRHERPTPRGCISGAGFDGVLTKRGRQS